MESQQQLTEKSNDLQEKSLNLSTNLCVTLLLWSPFSLAMIDVLVVRFDFTLNGLKISHYLQDLSSLFQKFVPILVPIFVLVNTQR